MNYDQCVGHHISGRYKGQRCKAKGVSRIWRGKEFKTCYTHRSSYSDYMGKWAIDLLQRSLLGRYDHA